MNNILNQKTSTGVHIFLEDTSGNGTFINGEKVGKGNKQVLANNDEVSLAVKKNKAYMFLDNNIHKRVSPQEIAACFHRCHDAEV
ncbi:Serine/threonine-protein kinase Chk2 [Mizuhopecten yessoensis]|uniref:Serine/threonine-protein kinase Chk2 n=1 Tax=Mizuhopecten yessoensis TaxID=6573 RepID=A0A210R6Q5_MIZYE|nr:Serine/threonine-protein kinase Chk2 [Mizuhopecten yessoensis]